MQDLRKLGTYDGYVMNKNEFIRYGVAWLLISAVLSFMFYRSVIAFFLIGMAMPLYFKKIGIQLREKRKTELLAEFKDCLLAVQAALEAGYSTENAFRQVYGEMAMLYTEQADMVKELYRIASGLNNNIVLEQLLNDFACRCQIEEIVDFAEVFRISKRTGGDLEEIIRTTIGTIDGRTEVLREVETMVASQSFELKIMSLVPLFILLYVGSTTPGFFDCLYHNLTGNLLMTGCMAVYVSAILIGEKTMRVKFR